MSHPAIRRPAGSLRAVRGAALVAALALCGLASAPLRAADDKPAERSAASPEVRKPGVVDLNKATEKELESLPGVGPALAKRILDYRQTAGSFKKVDELLNVKGIGEKSLERIRPLVAVIPAGASQGKP